MTSRGEGNLKLGSGVVELLLPQRRPFLMVDFVSEFHPDPVPTLKAGRHISINEVFFNGHLPGLPIWPGVLTIEGMGQTASLLMTLSLMRERAHTEGRNPDDLLESLRNLDRGFRLHPGYRANQANELLEWMRDFKQDFAVGAGVEIKLLQPVLPGQRLDYAVRWTERFGNLARFEVEASVETTTVAKGSLTGARGIAPVGEGAAGPR